MSILNEFDDHSIFAWTDPADVGQPRGLLAPHPSCFEGSRNVIKTTRDSINRPLISRPCSATDVGLCAQFELSPSPFPAGVGKARIFSATLDCSLMPHNGIAILLQRLSWRGDQFGHVGCRKLELRGRNSDNRGTLETVYV